MIILGKNMKMFLIYIRYIFNSQIKNSKKGCNRINKLSKI